MVFSSLSSSSVSSSPSSCFIYVYKWCLVILWTETTIVVKLYVPVGVRVLLLPLYSIFLYPSVSNRSVVSMHERVAILGIPGSCPSVGCSVYSISGIGENTHRKHSGTRSFRNVRPPSGTGCQTHSRMLKTLRLVCGSWIFICFELIPAFSSPSPDLISPQSLLHPSPLSSLPPPPPPGPPRLGLSIIFAKRNEHIAST